MKKLPLLAALALASAQIACAATLTVATYNIRYDNDGDTAAGNGWKTRCPFVASLIRFHDFDVFGAQEARGNQVEDMAKQLPGYAWLGNGRDGGLNGEFVPIFYKAGKFDLLDQGTFWISPITDKPNKGWDSAHPRICTWAKFSSKETGKIFFFFNAHLDHRGVQARAEGAKLVLEKIGEIAKGADAILTGDFNMEPSAKGYQAIASSGVLKDSREIANLRYETNGTFNGFKTGAFSTKRIDYIFVSKGFSLARYGVLTDTYRSAGPDGKYSARMPSDHFPVMARLEY